MMMLGLTLISLCYLVRLRGLRTTAPPYLITGAFRSLQSQYDPVHIDIVSIKRFEDEVVVDTTLYARNGTFYTASARGRDLIPALRGVVDVFLDTTKI